MVVPNDTSSGPNVLLVLLGDLRRAPRVQYTCDALLKYHHLSHLDLVCSTAQHMDTSHVPQLASSTNRVTIHEYGRAPEILEYSYMVQKFGSFMPKSLMLILNVIRLMLKFHLMIYFLLVAMLKAFLKRKIDFVILVNPPLFPSFFPAFILTRIFNSKLIIDWHNFSYSMVMLQFSTLPNFIVSAFKWLEYKCGSCADLVTVVSSSMQELLIQNSNLNTAVVYDKSYSSYRFESEAKKEEFYNLTLDNKYNIIDSNDFLNDCITTKRKPFILTTSSSWSLDDDFQILLDACRLLDQNKQLFTRIPYLICIMTGKGPQKEEFVKKLKDEYKFENIVFKFPFLDADDYIKLMAVSDVGLSLHASSSKVDLPIKVLDMFGANLPVLSLKYGCISELVHENLNGKLFETYGQLAELIELCIERPELLKGMQEYLNDNLVLWDEYWTKEVSHHYRALLVQERK